MKKAILSLLVAAIALPGLARTSAPSRVAVINVQRVLLESNQGKVAREKLEKVAKQKQDKPDHSKVDKYQHPG